MQGCVQRVFFGDVNAATVRVLAAEGFEVHAPRQPRCCGSLMMHAGLEEEALVLARETIAAYEDFDAIGVNVAGCGSGMKDYAHLLADDPEWAERAKAFSAKVKDVPELLAGHEPRVVRHPLALKVAYHDACHLAHAQGVRDAAARAAALDPRARARRARRVGDLLRLGRASTTSCSPRRPPSSGSARPTTSPPPSLTRSPPPTPAARCRSPGISIEQDPDLPPDDAAGRLAAQPATRGDPMSTASRIDAAPAPSSEERANDILSPEALDFVAELHGRFEPRRQELLAARRERAKELQAGGTLDFLEETREIREGDWQVAAAAPTTTSTAASRSPARPTASSSSTRSTRAPRASWPTSRTRPPRRGRTSSSATST